LFEEFGLKRVEFDLNHNTLDFIVDTEIWYMWNSLLLVYLAYSSGFEKQVRFKNTK
jgi:hypothetical protein